MARTKPTARRRVPSKKKRSPKKTTKRSPKKTKKRSRDVVPRRRSVTDAKNVSGAHRTSSAAKEIITKLRNNLNNENFNKIMITTGAFVRNSNRVTILVRDINSALKILHELKIMSNERYFSEPDRRRRRESV
jgi:histone H3/H4